MRQFSKLEQRLLNEFQQGMPLTPNPYADIAKQLGIYETTVLETLRRLQTEGVVSRVGAVFRPNRIGVSTLAAISVPQSKLEESAAIINAFDEVNHNYEREHQYNLWFVVVAADEDRLQEVLSEIEASCGYAVLDLPLLNEFFIDLGFDLKWT
ncbi:MAG: Lrp/AsnC family transcriptional regulator [Gammaproteobacteria bacterium]|nr:Lrp/AsnC family transcriptional regulator [Gammaproteobacteria bacterium]MCP4981984.1 Lrp/AsnC family transcriptional regulator [Gammaproteobacteria bacterium]